MTAETVHAGKFIETLREIGVLPLRARGLDILQVNLGYRCNLACKHCHVQAGPHRTEMMAREDIEAVIHRLAESPIRTLDLTGGAPELHPDFRFLVTTARAIGCQVMVRSNEYLGKLQSSFNPATLEGIMCRRLVNVGWDGALFDCDFNAIAGLKVGDGCPQHIADFDFDRLSRREIVLSDHCFGCTAGQGST